MPGTVVGPLLGRHGRVIYLPAVRAPRSRRWARGLGLCEPPSLFFCPTLCSPRGKSIGVPNQDRPRPASWPSVKRQSDSVGWAPKSAPGRRRVLAACVDMSGVYVFQPGAGWNPQGPSRRSRVEDRACFGGDRDAHQRPECGSSLPRRPRRLGQLSRRRGVSGSTGPGIRLLRPWAAEWLPRC